MRGSTVPTCRAVPRLQTPVSSTVNRSTTVVLRLHLPAFSLTSGAEIAVLGLLTAPFLTVTVNYFIVYAVVYKSISFV